MKLSLPILLTFTSLLLSFSLKGAKGIEEALFTWTDSPSTTLNVIWLVKDKDPTLFLWGQADQKDTQSAEVQRHSFYKGSGLEVCQVQLTGLNPRYWISGIFGRQGISCSNLTGKKTGSYQFCNGWGYDASTRIP